jgi:hypothetical protein
VYSYLFALSQVKMLSALVEVCMLRILTNYFKEGSTEST